MYLGACFRLLGIAFEPLLPGPSQGIPITVLLWAACFTGTAQALGLCFCCTLLASWHTSARSETIICRNCYVQCCCRQPAIPMVALVAHAYSGYHTLCVICFFCPWADCTSCQQSATVLLFAKPNANTCWYAQWFKPAAKPLVCDIVFLQNPVCCKCGCWLMKNDHGGVCSGVFWHPCARTVDSFDAAAALRTVLGLCTVQSFASQCGVFTRM